MRILVVASSVLLVISFAVAALHLASVILQKDLKQWFAELTVDLDKVGRAAQLINQDNRQLF